MLCIERKEAMFLKIVFLVYSKLYIIMTHLIVYYSFL
jgi:hypothetical protein